MKKLSTSLSSVLVAGCAFLSVPALAANASALAELTGYGYELIDLDPNDGVTPALSVQTHTAYGYTYIRLLDYTAGDARYGQVETRSTHPSGFSLTDVTATGQRSQVVFQAVPGVGTAASQTINQFTFQLTPNTGFRFHMGGTLLAEPRLELGGASANLEGWFQSVSNGVNEYTSFEYRQSTSNGARDFAFGTYYETGNYTGSGTLYYGLTTSQTFAAPPVPEPATWGMLGLGLMAVGTAARRRQARPH